MWTYHQASGLLAHDGEPSATGYSGAGAGKNSPAMQDVPNVGPIPQGRYRIGPLFDSQGHGPKCMRVIPCEGTETFGRDGFLIHGDSIAAPGTASHGCIILTRPVREAIAASGDADLEVV
jgi:hypothetical protein